MPNLSSQPTNNIIFLEFQLCIGWWEGRTGFIGTFTFQWYHVIKYSCSNCITYQSFSIFNLHARFISWFMPNTNHWWGGRTASYFQKVALFYKDIHKWEKITNITSLSQRFLSRYARISMLWSNDSSQNRVFTDHYHLTVWLAPSLTNGADAVSFMTSADHQLSVFTWSKAPIYPRKEI